jgi:hypothetical protein
MEYDRESNDTILEKLIRRDGSRCSVCGATNMPLQVHHRVPLSEGGNDSLDNLVLVCQKCHMSREGLREYEFEDYILRLVTLNEDFRNVRHHARVSNRAWLRPDILAEERVEGTWRSIIIECKSSATFTFERLSAAIAQLRVYRNLSPSSKLILAFPGTSSKQASQILRNSRIEIWDLPYLSQRFAYQIPKAQHPILQSLLAGVKAVRVKSREQILIDELDLCRPGKRQWGIYQKLVGAILEQLFCPPLLNPLPQKQDVYDVNRRDYIMPNYAEYGFWSFLRLEYSAHYIVVDAKNHRGKVKKDSILQVANYLKTYGAGLFGLIVCRNGCDRSSTHLLRETWIVDRKLIIILTDYDLKEMLLAKSGGAQPETIIRQTIEDFRLGL